jgi:hypothetical protein
MAYRSPEEALRQRAAELEAEIGAVDERLPPLRAELALVEREAEAAKERLREAGPAAGPRGAVRDRVAVATIVLAVVGAALFPLHVYWNLYVVRDHTVIPAILILAAPGALAALIAWPYRDITAACRWTLRAGAVLALSPFLNVLIGFIRGPLP